MESQQRIRLKIAHKILKSRKDKSWSVDVLAEKAGLSKSSMNYIERGITDPKLSSLVSISKALEISLEELIRID